MLREEATIMGMQKDLAGGRGPVPGGADAIRPPSVPHGPGAAGAASASGNEDVAAGRRVEIVRVLQPAGRKLDGSRTVGVAPHHPTGFVGEVDSRVEAFDQAVDLGG
jgi:hypothetical protein